MEPLISIIVPVYKVEAYLGPCVDSILAQTYRNIEIILVDDGSPDCCGGICDDYANRDSRVVVIHKKNGGLSDARNAGMEIAKGDYFVFVDSDDLLPEKAVETLLEIAQRTDAQLVIGDHRRFADVPEATGESHGYGVMTTEEAMGDMFRNGCAAWARLYRREVHEGILYPVGEINEDEAIVLRLLERCSRVAKTDAVVYHYRCRPESITTSSFSPKKMHWPEHCAANLRIVQEKWPELEEVAAARYRGSLLWVLSEIALSNERFPEIAKSSVKQLRQHRRLFRRVPFRFRQDRIRVEVLIYLPFGFYKKMLRLKRRA
ncbi:MAG: glycosyltransferase family 2 protein [Oscillospiraceae bacterium]|nr:glycosyltransferase family 2 protein [Oscillospiraceae bacterium]